jgi:hypothetical protein
MEPDCTNTPKVVCPHCGYVYSESWELFSVRDDIKTNCRECEKRFQCTERTTYTSSKIEEKKHG